MCCRENLQDPIGPRPELKGSHGRLLEDVLYFTDTIEACIYRYTEAAGLTVLVTDGGGYDGKNCEDIESRAEPGSNGMAADPMNPGQVLICQHPTHRVVRAALLEMEPGSRFCDNNFEVGWCVWCLGTHWDRACAPCDSVEACWL